ncbi:hypothetical protein KIPB_008378 [Kipferlia bialata]|uniref:Guanine nucleotide-binding protein subunit beta-like protein n=1 Tax=Kipferlia bialata TaxID=797122 RepID=A0A9K3D0K7_9EUKA|nr:hypothetical protein KIPB_008378 [Kipferlia bialata]|eukprot:g8378.t1
MDNYNRTNAKCPLCQTECKMSDCRPILAQLRRVEVACRAGPLAEVNARSLIKEGVHRSLLLCLKTYPDRGGVVAAATAALVALYAKVPECRVAHAKSGTVALLLMRLLTEYAAETHSFMPGVLKNLMQMMGVLADYRGVSETGEAPSNTWVVFGVGKVLNTTLGLLKQEVSDVPDSTQNACGLTTSAAGLIKSIYEAGVKAGRQVSRDATLSVPEILLNRLRGLERYPEAIMGCLLVVAEYTTLMEKGDIFRGMYASGLPQQIGTILGSHCVGKLPRGSLVISAANILRQMCNSLGAKGVEATFLLGLHSQLPGILRAHLGEPDVVIALLSTLTTMAETGTVCARMLADPYPKMTLQMMSHHPDHSDLQRKACEFLCCLAPEVPPPITATSEGTCRGCIETIVAALETPFGMSALTALKYMVQQDTQLPQLVAHPGFAKAMFKSASSRKGQIAMVDFLNALDTALYPDAIRDAWADATNYVYRAVVDTTTELRSPVECLARDTLTPTAAFVQSRAFAAGYRDGTIRRWDLTPLTKEQRTAGASSGGVDTEHNTHGIHVLTPTLTIAAHEGPALSLDWCGDRVASGGGDGRIKLWNPATGGCLWTAEAHTSPINALKFAYGSARSAKSGTADCVVFAGGDTVIRLFDIAKKEVRTAFTGHTATVCCLDVRGTTLASGSSDLTARIWDVKTGTQTSVLSGHTGSVNACCYDTTDAILATGSSDMTVRLWDTRTGRATLAFKDLQGEVTCLWLDGDRVVFGTTTGRHYASDRRQPGDPCLQFQMGGSAASDCICFPEYLISGSTSGSIRAHEIGLN